MEYCYQQLVQRVSKLRWLFSFYKWHIIRQITYSSNCTFNSTFDSLPFISHFSHLSLCCLESAWRRICDKQPARVLLQIVHENTLELCLALRSHGLNSSISNHCYKNTLWCDDFCFEIISSLSTKVFLSMFLLWHADSSCFILFYNIW